MNAIDARRVGMKDSEYIDLLERENRILTREAASLRESEGSLRRKLEYMDKHYVPKRVRV